MVYSLLDCTPIKFAARSEGPGIGRFESVLNFGKFESFFVVTSRLSCHIYFMSTFLNFKSFSFMENIIMFL